MTPLLHTLPEAAEQLGGVSVRTLEREIADGQLAVTYVRGQRRIARADLEAYIARHRRFATAPATACPSANVVMFGTSASRSAESELSELLARGAKTRAPSRRRSAARRSTSV